MKKFNLLLLLPLLLADCTPKTNTGVAASKKDTVKYAYSIPKPDNWVIDTNTTNTQIALNALKAFENGDTAAFHKYWADTVVFNYDGGKFKGPLKEFLVMSKQEKDSFKALSIKMVDWEPVVSKDGSEKWVTLWYKQITTDMKGQTDSVGIVNDFLFKGSKITRLDEYQRHLVK
jgi:hypothetical protein